MWQDFEEAVLEAKTGKSYSTANKMNKGNEGKEKQKSKKVQRSKYKC